MSFGDTSENETDIWNEVLD